MLLVSITDQMGQSVTLNLPPRKIVSLVPSQTELLHSLGLEKEVCGITKFCIHPDSWHRTKKHIGGTKHFDFKTIEQLSPDLIIGNKEENYQEGIEALRGKYPVWMSDINDLDDALTMIRSIGNIVDRAQEAEQLVNVIQGGFDALPQRTKARVLYLIWRKPWMAAGRNTFINDMLQRSGFENAITDSRYPELSENVIQQLDPDYIFLSSEPYPFKEAHRKEISNISPLSKILLVDGEMFSWYGSRLRLACDYFRQLSIS
jgi:ABC-type Fe3+-hydroxamate transport system substrate-binding protein